MNDEMLCAERFEAGTGNKPSYQYEDDRNPGRYNTKIRDSYVEWLETLAAVTLRNKTSNAEHEPRRGTSRSAPCVCSAVGGDK